MAAATGRVTQAARLSSYVVLCNEASRSFPCRPRPSDPTRIKVVIRNLGVNSFNVAFGSNANNNYSPPSWTGAATVAPSQEWVTEGSSAPIFVAPLADGTAIIVGTYTELGMI